MKLKKTAGFTVIETLIVVAILGIIAAIVIPAFSASDGVRVGVVTKFSRKGIIVKTWEGEAMLGSVNSGDRWAFSIDESNPEKSTLAEAIDSASAKSKPIRLVYHQVGFPRPWRGETPYYVVAIRDIEK